MIKRCYGVMTLLIAWQLMSWGIKSAIVPSPVYVLTYFFTRFVSEMALHLISSFYRIGIAMGIAAVLGILIGMFMGMSKRGNALISPIVYLSYPIPKIAFLPVLMILFGLGDASKIILIVLIIAFPIMLGVRDGILEIPSEVHMSSKSLGLHVKDYLVHIIWPSILPKLLSSLRMSSGIAISALFFAENFATRYGIGYFIMNSWVMVDYVAMYSGIVAISLMGWVLFRLIDWAQLKWCPWL
jgi:NitT/TauT family transport system permease protein